MEGLKPILTEVGAVVLLSDDVVLIGDRYYVKATAELRDDKSSIYVTAFAREDNEKKGMDLAQVTGSVSSYARKYALNGLFCIDDTKDSDSTNQHGKEKDKPSQQSSQTRPTPRVPTNAPEGMPLGNFDTPPPKGGWPDKPPATPLQNGKNVITEAQRKRLYAISKQHAVPDDELKKKVLSLGFQSGKDLDKTAYDKVVEWCEKYDDPDNFTMPEDA